MESSAKNAFNLKVLRRHDPTITEILESASFVVLYNHNSEWTKTGVEGPLFLFRRSVAPYNGFFIMNRNGVENFSANLAADDDLEITPDFIIYRPESSDETDVYGIWIFEGSQREIIGQQMLKLQQMSSPPNSTPENLESSSSLPPSPQAQSATDSISLDDLFGSSTAASSQPTAPSSTEQQQASHETNLLSALFGQAAIGSSSSQPKAESASTNGPPAQQAQDSSAQNLLALLGVKPQASTNPAPASSSASATPAPAETSKPASRSRTPAPPDTPKSFKPSRRQPARDKVKPQEQPSAKPNGVSVDAATSASAAAPKMSELVEQGLKGLVGLGDDGSPLSRREFVQELLSLIHTEPTFVDELHKTYVDRVSS